MKIYNIIDLVDEAEFRSEVMTDLPEQWEANLRYKDGSYYIYVSKLEEEPLERLLKANNIRFIAMIVEEREYNGYNVTIAEDNKFYYIYFNTGMGDGSYVKSEWTLDKALEDQANLFKEYV